MVITRLSKPLFTIHPNKFKYFFGKVIKGSKHNVQRSAQNLKDLTIMGIETEEQLVKVFKEAAKNGTVTSTQVSQLISIITYSWKIRNTEERKEERLLSF